ncbi:hypothetical protein F5876DRAFT_81054 [Lentinula aff. lateritia]|uniref:Uncharacterized protein n=1 Tax=Lentinula aff. lateritia TaxID=2804960 RepID=A0ACC1TMW7_9AGAR|nr:hypothetical protein F5876DRAFT_81054 [Lentinula aff. lateritia]
MDGPTSNSRKRRSSSAMDIDMSQRSFRSDVSMEGSVATITGDSLTHIEETPEIDAGTDSRGSKIRLLSAFEMDPHHRQRIHTLEDLLGNKENELKSLALDIDLKNSTITALESKMADLHMDMEDAKQHYELQNSGAWAKVEELDVTHKKVESMSRLLPAFTDVETKLLQKNIGLIERIFDQDTELHDLRTRLSAGKAELNKMQASSQKNLHPEALELECHNLKLQVEALSQSNTTLSSTNTSLQKLKIDLENLVKKLRDEDIVQLKTERQTLQDSLDSMNGTTEKLSKLQSDYLQLGDDLTFVTQQKTKLGDKLSRASEEIKQLEDNNSKLALKASDAQTKLQRAETEKNSIEEDNQQISNDFDMLKEDHDALKADHDALKADHQAVTDAHTSLRTRFNNLSGAHSALKQQTDTEIERIQHALSESEKANETCLVAKESKLKNDRNQIRELSERIASIDNEKERQMEKIRELERLCREKDTSQQSEKDSSEAHLEDLKRKLKDAYARNLELVGKADKAHQIAQDLVDEKTRLLNEAVEARRKVQELEDEMGQLVLGDTATIDKLRDDTAAANRRI